MTAFRLWWSRLRWVEDVRRDLRHTLRSFTRNPGFATVVILTLGLGIGATTAVFSVVNAVVLRPLNAPHADRLVRSLSIYNGQRMEAPSAGVLKAWLDLRDVFEDVAAHRLDSVALTGTSEPEQISVGRVSEPFFRLFGAPLIAGRTFSPEEDHRYRRQRSRHRPARRRKAGDVRAHGTRARWRDLCERKAAATRVDRTNGDGSASA